MKPKRNCSTVAALLVAVVIFFGGALPAIAMEFVLIRGDTFTMGSPEGEVDHEIDETQHQVRVSDFYIAKYEVTVGEFRKFVAATRYQTDAEAENGGGSYIWNVTKWEKIAGVNWRHGISGSLRPQNEENHPVVHVSWNDAVAYCKALSAKTGKRYRLPTEAEWEYACRAGNRKPFNTGENLTTNQANYNGNYPYNGNPKGEFLQNTVPVNSFAPNRFGLYNMHGNVWEWCSDWYSETYYNECKAQGTVTNPDNQEKGSDRVLRGGGWIAFAGRCRSAYRYCNSPGFRLYAVGFRLVFVP